MGYKTRIQAVLSQWKDNAFLQSLLEQVDNGRDLSERQVQALSNIEAGVAKRKSNSDREESFIPF